MMNSCILLIANEINRTYKKHKILRIFLTSLSGSLLEIIVLILLKNYMLYLIFSHFIIIPLMVFTAFGRCEIKLFLKNSAACYGVALLLGGCTEAVENIWGIHQLPFLAGALGVLVCISLFHFFRGERSGGRSVFPVEFIHNGRKICCAGLLDTGNRLREPLKNRPVSIVTKDIIEKLGVDEQDFSGIAIYRTLGKSAGTLETYRVERLSVKQNGKWRHSSPAVIAAAPEELLRGKRYEAIINGTDIFD